MLTLIDYKTPADMVGWNEATQEQQSCVAYWREKFKAELGNIPTVPYDRENYRAFLGSREDTHEHRAAWASSMTENGGSMSLVRSAICGYAHHQQCKTTAAIATLAGALQVSPNTLYVAQREDKRADLYVAAIHAQYTKK